MARTRRGGCRARRLAQARYVRVTPMKARRVVDLIRGMKADEALALLKFAPQAAQRAGRQGARERGRQRRAQPALTPTTLWSSARPTSTRARRSSGSGRARRAARTASASAPATSPSSSSRATTKAAADAGRATAIEEEDPLVGQKVNPHGFRLGITTDFTSRWFADSSKDGQRYRDYVKEDVAIRKMMTKGMERAGITKVEIERTRDRVRVDIHTARPGIVIGRRGAEADRIRGDLEKLTGKQVQLNILEVKNPEIDAQLVAQGVAEQLPAASRFRRAMRKAMQSRDEGRRQGHPGAVLGSPRRRRDEPLGVLPRGSGAAAHAARQHRLRLLRGPHHLRPHRRQGLDLQGRRHRRREPARAERAAAAALAPRAAAAVRRGRAAGAPRRPAAAAPRRPPRPSRRGRTAAATEPRRAEPSPRRARQRRPEEA